MFPAQFKDICFIQIPTSSNLLIGKAQTLCLAQNLNISGILLKLLLFLHNSLKLSDEEHIPEDGIILDDFQLDIAEGETVYDILAEASRVNGIQFENNGTESLAYIVGIGYIYEMQFGDLSGWVYHVNGSSPSVGCGEYRLSDGDRIEWIYTLDFGGDAK